MISIIMDDHEFEEERLLNSFGDHRTQFNQNHYRNSNNNSSIYYNYYTPSSHIYHYHHHYRRHYPRRHAQNEQDLEPLDWKTTPDNIGSNGTSGKVSTGSMTVEDFLDDFELFPEKGDHNSEFEPNECDQMSDSRSNHSAPSTNDKQPVLSRSITFYEKEEGKESSSKIVEKATESRDAKPTHRRSKSDDSSSSVIHRVEKPIKDDILCGQSRVCANHPGNQYFQEVLESFASKYDRATSKQEKMCMTKEIVSRIHDTGGRFLKQRDGMWEEISTVAARDKVSHALRTKVASWKRNRAKPTVTPPQVPRRVSLSRKSLILAKSLSRKASMENFDPIRIDSSEARSSQMVLENMKKNQREEFLAMLKNSDSNSNKRVQSTYRDNHHYSVER